MEDIIDNSGRVIYLIQGVYNTDCLIYALEKGMM